MPPVEKSGYSLGFFPFKISMEAFINSLKLCGRILVDNPTAIPSTPCAKSNGNFTGSVTVSFFRRKTIAKRWFAHCKRRPGRALKAVLQYIAARRRSPPYAHLPNFPAFQTAILFALNSRWPRLLPHLREGDIAWCFQSHWPPY